MKSITLILGLVISSIGYTYSNSSSSTEFNGKLYIPCDTCLSESDFVRAAESKAFIESFSINAKSLTYVVFNSRTLKISTVLVDVGIGAVGRVVENSEEDNVFVDDYAQKLSSFELNAYSPTETDPDNYTAISKMLNVIDISADDTLEIDAPWAYSVTFNIDVQDELNRLVQQHANPLMFIGRPVSINVKTSDGAIVNLISKDLSANASWEVALVLYGYQALRGAEKELDGLGNSLDKIGSSPYYYTCFASAKFEFCREIINGNQPVGPTLLRHLTYQPHPTPPKGCNILTEECKTILD